jgi:hypothetical protein
VGLLGLGAWLVGLACAGLLSIAASSEREVVATVARIVFAAGLTASLLATAAVFTAAGLNPVPQLQPTRSGWWAFVILAAIPVAAICAVSVRRAYRSRPQRTALAVGTAAALALFALVPLAFVPRGEQLRGFALDVHRHHVLVILALLVPGLIQLAGAAPGRPSK